MSSVCVCKHNFSNRIVESFSWRTQKLWEMQGFNNLFFLTLWDVSMDLLLYQLLQLDDSDPVSHNKL